MVSRIQPIREGTDMANIVHFLPIMGMRSPVAKEATRAPMGTRPPTQEAWSSVRGWGWPSSPGWK